MKPHGWNGDYLEVGLSKIEAVALLRLTSYLADGTLRRIQGLVDPSVGLLDAEEIVVDRLIHSLAHHLGRVVGARTRLPSELPSYIPPPTDQEEVRVE